MNPSALYSKLIEIDNGRFKNLIETFDLKKVATFPKEWKVYPDNRPPHWEDNNTSNYFEDELDAMFEAEKRNNNEEKDS